jgi:hypothetical protein
MDKNLQSFIGYEQSGRVSAVKFVVFQNVDILCIFDDTSEMQMTTSKRSTRLGSLDDQYVEFAKN